MLLKASNNVKMSSYYTVDASVDMLKILEKVYTLKQWFSTFFIYYSLWPFLNLKFSPNITNTKLKTNV